MSFSDWLRLRENINPFKDKLLATATKLGGLLPNRAKPSSGSLEEKIEALLSRMFVAWKKRKGNEQITPYLSSILTLVRNIPEISPQEVDFFYKELAKAYMELLNWIKSLPEDV
jgi:hypothetical protein